MTISAIGSSPGLSTSMLSRMSNMQARPKIDPAEIAAKIIKQEDQDGDGAISAAETRLQTRQFNEIDADGDGLLTADELQTHFESRRPDMGARPPMMGGMGGMQGPPPPMDVAPADMAARILEQDDADGDGVLTADEARCDSTRFGEIDADGNGVLTAEELQAHFEARQAEMAEKSGDQPAAGEATAATSSLQSLLEMLSQREAGAAYADQTWLYDMLQTSAQSLRVNA